MFKVWHRGNLPKGLGGSEMKKLKLPVIRGHLSEARTLSMDDYFKFVQFNLTHAFDKKAYAKWKKMLVVNTPFLMR